MRRARNHLGDWLVVIVPLSVAILAVAVYFAWRWHQDSQVTFVYQVF